AAIAEAGDGLPRFGVQFLKIVADGENQPLVRTVLALPVVDAASPHAAHVFADPDFRARACVERDERATSATSVDLAVGHNGGKRGFAKRVVPRDLKLID